MPFCTPRTCDKLHYRHRKSLSLSMERIEMFSLDLFLAIQDICLRNVKKDFLLGFFSLGGTHSWCSGTTPARVWNPGQTCARQELYLLSLQSGPRNAMFKLTFLVVHCSWYRYDQFFNMNFTFKDFLPSIPFSNISERFLGPFSS